MTLDDLHHGQRVRARWGRAGPEDVAWGPWTEVTLHVQRAPDTPTNRKNKRVGALAALALQGVNWAEYGSDSFEPSTRLFLVEDYYLQIEGL